MICEECKSILCNFRARTVKECEFFEGKVMSNEIPRINRSECKRIEVRIGTVWEERICLFVDESRVICVDKQHEKSFEIGFKYDTAIWDKWREIKELQYRPFNKDDDPKIFGYLIGSKIRYKKDDSIHLITSTNCKTRVTLGEWTNTFDFLLENFEYLDGTPVGILKK